MGDRTPSWRYPITYRKKCNVKHMGTLHYLLLLVLAFPGLKVMTMRIVYGMHFLSKYSLSANLFYLHTLPNDIKTIYVSLSCFI